MSYGAIILPLEEVINISETLKNEAIKRFMLKSNDEDLAEYRDYQVSLLFYLNELKKKQ